MRLLQDLILGPQVVNHDLLLAIDPARENDEVPLPGLKDKAHAGPHHEAEKPHHGTWAAKRQGRTSPEKVTSDVSQFA